MTSLMMKRAEDYLTKAPVMATFLMIAGILLVGFIDLITGIEVRVFPLYFIPLSLGAWTLGYRGAITGTLLASASWYLANSSGGLVYSQPHIWIINVVAQGAAFAIVSLLIGHTREGLIREKQLARTDSLTGLLNSRSFREQAEHITELCRRHGRPVTFAYVDLDNFKSVNDRHGHTRGDDVLRAAAHAIRDGLRSSDICARIGGDEFAICLPETTETQASLLLERIRSQLVDSVQIPDCAVSASIGAVAWATPPREFDAMVRSADELMYEVKHHGKNRVRVINATP